MSGKNKKGWIRIVEAFLAIMLLLGLLVTLMTATSKITIGKTLIEKTNTEILDELTQNSEHRETILKVNIESPYPFSQETAPNEDIRLYLEDKELSGTICKYVIYSIDENEEIKYPEAEEEVYTEERLIFSTSETFDPRKIKITCFKN